MEWRMAVLVAVGGAAGAVGRYALTGAWTRGDFPLGTLLVNVVGCLLIGLLVFGGIEGGWLGPEARVFLAVGVLGGFTTMSTFTYDTVALLSEGAVGVAAANVLLNLGACLGATWAGRAVALWIWGG